MRRFNTDGLKSDLSLLLDLRRDMSVGTKTRFWARRWIPRIEQALEGSGDLPKVEDPPVEPQKSPP